MCDKEIFEEKDRKECYRIVTQRIFDVQELIRSAESAIIKNRIIVENYYLIDDERLTWTAKGVAMYLQRHPGATATEIAAMYKGNKRGNGLEAVQAALEEIRLLRVDLTQSAQSAQPVEPVEPVDEPVEPVEPQEKITYSDGMLIVTEEAMEELARRYPSADFTDLQTELNKVEDWLAANPKRKLKSPWLFVLNWLRRSFPMEREEQPPPMTEYDRISARLSRRYCRIMEHRQAKGYSMHGNDGLPTDTTTYDDEGYPVAVQG